MVAHLHYVLIGGAVFPLFGAVYYWFPKFTGRMLGEQTGRVVFCLLFTGFNLTFFPMHALGVKGMPRRVYTYLPEQGWGTLNLLATAGALTLALAVLLFVVNVFWSRRYGLVAGPDPWGASTLEWATASPPPAYNFRHLPTVRGREALWEDPDGTTPVVTGLATDTREVLVTTMHDAVPDHRDHMAGDSIWPFLTALIIGATFVGLVFHPLAFPLGMAGLTITLLGWFWPSKEPEPIHHPQTRPSEAPAP